MANCSSASGTIIFKNKDLTNLARFIYYFNKLNGYAYYGTYIGELYDLDYNQTYELVKEDALLNDKKEYELEFSFIGTGRWTYYNNLDWFFNIKKKDDIITNYDRLVLGTIIDVDFIDEESEDEILYTYKASLHAKPNEYGEFNTIRENEEHVDYDHTAENIRYLLDDTAYSIDDAIKYPNNYFSAEALNKYHTEILKALENNKDRSIMYDFADFTETAKLEGLFPDIENLYVR